MDAFSGIDASKRETFTNLQNTPDSVAIIPGIAAYGKSTLLRFLMMSILYGDCPPESKEEDIVVFFNYNSANEENSGQRPDNLHVPNI